jgi:molecular chaperone HscA
VEAAVVVKPSYGLSDEDITRMLKDSVVYARDDMHARALHEQQVEAWRLLEAIEAALNEDGERLLSAEERGIIGDKMQVLRERAGGAAHQAIKQAIEALNQATTEFAARRMDSGVQKAFTGRKLEELET